LPVSGCLLAIQASETFPNCWILDGSHFAVNMEQKPLTFRPSTCLGHVDGTPEQAVVPCTRIYIWHPPHSNPFALQENRQYICPCKFVLLLHPIERLSLFLPKFVLLGQKYSLMILSNSKRQHKEREYWKNSSSSLDNFWPKPDNRIYIGPIGRDHSHRDCGHDSSASSGRVWQLDIV
jgi:hypothetical protein